MKKKMLLAVVALGLAFSMAACSKNNNNGTNNKGNNAGTNAGNNKGTAKVDVQAIYKQNCVSCHATDLSGGMGPNLQKVGSRLSKKEIVTRINNGGGGMPAFKGVLKDNQINALADWLSKKK